jgi:hypothetical protein
MSQLILQDIRECWDEIRPGLDHTRRKIDAPWRPEDVYAACVTGKAYLYTGDPGFIVVQSQINAFNGRPEMFLWVAYARGQDNIETFQDQVDEIAIEHGFDRIVMWSNRPGFQKSSGWQSVANVYERVLRA